MDNFFDASCAGCEERRERGIAGSRSAGALRGTRRDLSLVFLIVVVIVGVRSGIRLVLRVNIHLVIVLLSLTVHLLEVPSVHQPADALSVTLSRRRVLVALVFATHQLHLRRLRKIAADTRTARTSADIKRWSRRALDIYRTGNSGGALALALESDGHS